MCRIKKRNNMSSQFPPNTRDMLSSMNSQFNPKESTNAQANEQNIASTCHHQTKKSDGDHIPATNKAIGLKQSEQKTDEAHAVKAIEDFPEATPPEVKVSSAEGKQKTSKRTAVKEDELHTCSTQTMLTEESMRSTKKQIALEDTQVTTEMKPTNSRVTYELSTDDTLAGVPKVMPHFED